MRFDLMINRAVPKDTNPKNLELSSFQSVTAAVSL